MFARPSVRKAGQLRRKGVFLMDWSTRKREKRTKKLKPYEKRVRYRDGHGLGCFNLLQLRRKVPPGRLSLPALKTIPHA